MMADTRHYGSYQELIDDLFYGYDPLAQIGYSEFSTREQIEAVDGAIDIVKDEIDLVDDLAAGNDFELPRAIEDAIFQWVFHCSEFEIDPYTDPRKLDQISLERWLNSMLAIQSWVVLLRLRDRTNILANSFSYDQIAKIGHQAGSRVTAEKKRLNTLRTSNLYGKPTAKELLTAHSKYAAEWYPGRHNDQPVDSEEFLRCFRLDCFPAWRGKGKVSNEPYGKGPGYSEDELDNIDRHGNTPPVSIKTIRNHLNAARKNIS